MRWFSKHVLTCHNPVSRAWFGPFPASLKTVLFCCFNFCQSDGQEVVFLSPFLYSPHYKLNIFLNVYWSFTFHLLKTAYLYHFTIFLKAYPFSYRFERFWMSSHITPFYISWQSLLVYCSSFYIGYGLFCYKDIFNLHRNWLFFLLDGFELYALLKKAHLIPRLYKYYSNVFANILKLLNIKVKYS